MPNLGRRLVVVGLVAATLVACGGDDDASDTATADESDAPVDTADVDIADAADSSDSAADGGGSVVVGSPTATADAGSAWVEVDGRRIDYVASGSINVECTISNERVVVNFQTPDGRDLLVQGATQDGTWFISTTFAAGEDDNVRYSTDSSGGRGTFTLGDGALSYEGTVARLIGVDITNAEDVAARMAVNCAPAGGGADPSAEVGGTTYTFPISGAQSVTCDVAADAVEIRINRLALEGLQLEVSGTMGADGWLGNVTVYTADGNLRSALPADGTGITIDGSTFEYEGSFETATGDQPGTVSVTC